MIGKASSMSEVEAALADGSVLAPGEGCDWMAGGEMTARLCIAARSGLKMSQGELAEAAGVSRGTIAAIERGEEKILRNNWLAVVESFRRKGVTFDVEGTTETVVFRLAAQTDGGL